jgi:hypothetical protein
MADANKPLTREQLLQAMEEVENFAEFVAKYPDGPVKTALLALREACNAIPDEIGKAAEASSLTWNFDSLARTLDRILAPSLALVTQTVQSLEERVQLQVTAAVEARIASGELIPKEKHVTLCSEASTAAAEAAMKTTREQVAEEARLAGERQALLTQRAQVLQSAGIVEAAPEDVLALPEADFEARKTVLVTRLEKAKSLNVADRLPAGRIFQSDADWSLYVEAAELGAASAAAATDKSKAKPPAPLARTETAKVADSKQPRFRP